MMIPVSSPYVEVRMDTSVTYALVKARTDTSGIYATTRHTCHTHTLHVTYTIDKHSLRALFTRTIYTIRTQFTSTLYARTSYAPDLRVQSTHPTYVIRHVIRLSLARTYYTSLFGAHVFIIESVPNSKLSSLFPEKKHSITLAIRIGSVYHTCYRLYSKAQTTASHSLTLSLGIGTVSLFICTRFLNRLI